MEYILSLNLVGIGELTLIGIVIGIFTQAIKQLPIANKLMPLISMLLGIVGGLVVGIVNKDVNLFQTSFVGFLVGGTTSGTFNAVKGITGGYDKSTAEQTVPQTGLKDEPQQVGSIALNNSDKRRGDN